MNNEQNVSNDEYTRSYMEWVSDRDNPYGFTRHAESHVHSYTAGHGYNRPGPDAEEHKALYNCLSTLGLAMLCFLGMDVVRYVLLYSLFGPSSTGINILYYSQRFADPVSYSPLAISIYLLMVILKFALAIHIIQSRTKLPTAVIMGHPHQRSMVSFNSIIVLLVIMVVGRLCGLLLSRILDLVHVDTVYCLMINDSSVFSSLVSAILNCVLMPIMIEVLFRGCVLQLFKQFGDTFAVIISSVVTALCFYDLSYMGYVLCCAIVLGIVNVSAGSLRLSVIMHSIANSINYALVLVGFLDKGIGRIVEIGIYFLICTCALVVYFRFNDEKMWRMSDIPKASGLKMEKKFETVLSSNTVALWFVLVLVAILMQNWFL